MITKIIKGSVEYTLNTINKNEAVLTVASKGFSRFYFGMDAYSRFARLASGK